MMPLLPPSEILPLQPQIEIAELVDGDDVAAGSGSRQRSVNHGPTRRRRI
jgi:hypothetical protein